MTVLFVEHDMEIVERFADRVLAFYDGTVIADGTPAVALADAARAGADQRHQAEGDADRGGRRMLKVDGPQRRDRAGADRARRVARA